MASSRGSAERADGGTAAAVVKARRSSDSDLLRPLSHKAAMRSRGSVPLIRGSALASAQQVLRQSQENENTNPSPGQLPTMQAGDEQHVGPGAATMKSYRPATGGKLEKRPTSWQRPSTLIETPVENMTTVSEAAQRRDSSKEGSPGTEMKPHSGGSPKGSDVSTKFVKMRTIHSLGNLEEHSHDSVPTPKPRRRRSQLATATSDPDLSKLTSHNKYPGLWDELINPGGDSDPNDTRVGETTRPFVKEVESQKTVNSRKAFVDSERGQIEEKVTASKSSTSSFGEDSEGSVDASNV